MLCNRSLLQLSIIIIYSKRGFNSCVMINNYQGLLNVALPIFS